MGGFAATSDSRPFYKTRMQAVDSKILTHINMSLKINKRQFKLWIAALDSGEYKQGHCRLQGYDTGKVY